MKYPSYFFAILFMVNLLNAQGIVRGFITDAKSEEPLIGVSVYLDGTELGTSTDRSGAYILTNVPDGKYQLVAEYLGYSTQKKEISVTDDEIIRQDLSLNAQLLEAEKLVVEGMRQGQARALNIQKNADRIENVVSADAIGRFPDPNTAEALQRIPAISIQRDQGEGRYVLIRGTEARLNSVMINGERIPAPEGDIRQVALDVIPADMLSSIEVVKSLTPDMDADAIGGSINLITRSALDYNDMILKATAASGYNPISEDGNYQGALTYGNKIGKLGYIFSLDGTLNNRGSNNIEMDYLSPEDINDAGYNSKNVYDDVQLRDYTVTRHRIGFSGDFDYRLSDNSRFYLRTLWNEFGDQEYRRRFRWRFGKGDIAVNHNIGTATDARIERDLKDRYEVQHIWSVSAGGVHQLGQLGLDYNFSYSYADEDEPGHYDATFVQKHMDLEYNRSDYDFPTLTATTGDPYDYSAFDFDELAITDNLTTDHDLTFATNLKIPVPFAEIKVGVKYRGKTKERNNTSKIFDGYTDDLTLADLDGSFEDTNFLDDKYHFGLSPDAQKVRDFYAAHKNGFEEDVNASHEESDAADYNATENIIAGYAMAHFNLGKLLILPGLRYEMTSLEYTGYEVLFDENSDYVSTNKLKKSHDYSNIFPALHFKYKLNDFTNLRAAYTTSIARPNYYDLVPYQLINREDEEMSIGNSELKPTQSVNFDLFAEHYFTSIGVLSGGFFYKNLDKYIYNKAFTQSGGTYTGYDVVQPVNGNAATLMGFEVSWQQQLTFLPGALNGFGIYLNYTYTSSEVEIPSRNNEKATLPGQSTHVGNFSLSYEKYGFSGRIAVNYHGSYLDEVGSVKELDRYYDDHVQFDISASYEIIKNLRVFAEFLNLSDAPLRYYFDQTSRPSQQEYYKWWTNAGLKYEF